MRALCVSVAIAAAVALAAAGPAANLSGAWRLNVERSSWGARPKPVSVNLQVDHKEPALSYSGVVVYSGEDARPFSFTGAIDGKVYAMERSFGSGTVTIRRIDPLTIESIFRSEDGKAVETTRTSLAAGGKTLTRRIRLDAAGVSSVSTEIYDRQ